MDSITYYDKNANEFFKRTIHAPMCCKKFLNHIPNSAKILDAGCGVGRDSKFFQDLGHDVLPFDGSLEMVKLTSTLLGKEALQLRFQEMNFLNEFDAAWANASLLHVPYEDLRGVFENFHKALTFSGILYASFKYGTSVRYTDDRVFFDMDEKRLHSYLQDLFIPLEIWKSADARKIAANPDQSWLNFVAKRS